MPREDVQHTVIEPMLVTYLPPRHLRYAADGCDIEELRDKALEQYVRALERFDEPTLKKAFAQVRDTHEYSIWPTPAKFVEAAKRSEPRPAPPTEEQERRSRAEEMTAAKLREYRKTSKLYKQAEREGWSGHLIGFVEGQLWVQAQILTGCKGIGFDASLLGSDGNALSSKEALRQIRDWMGKRFSEEEKLIVKPPTAELIRHWKQATQPERPPGPLDDVMSRLRERVHERGAPRVNG